MKTARVSRVRKTTAQNATTGCKACGLPATHRGYCAAHENKTYMRNAKAVAK